MRTALRLALAGAASWVRPGTVDAAGQPNVEALLRAGPEALIV